MGNSYWQQGCDDAKAGRPANRYLRYAPGYKQGFYWGQHGTGLWEAPIRAQIEWDKPVMTNPYMAVIEAIEKVLTKVNDPTNGLAKEKRDAYTTDMLEVRDTLHRYRQAEMKAVA